MKNDLPYFSHDNDARNHPKMKALRARFGWSGYGQFWALNEMIAHAKDARLDLSKKRNRLATADDLGLSLDTFEDFLAFISDPEIDLVNYSEGVLTTDRTQEDYAAVRAKRERDQGKYHTNNGPADGNVDSASENSNSASGFDTEQSRAEQNKEELASCADLTEEELKSFSDFCLAKASADPKVRKKSAYAKSLMAQADVLEEFRQSLIKPPKTTTAIAPEPGPCMKCGGKIKANRYDATGRCLECGAWHHFSREGDDWFLDQEQPERAEAADSG